MESDFQISPTAMLVAVLKTIKSVDVPSTLLLNPDQNDTGLLVSYNEEAQTFTIALGENNGSNNNEQLQSSSELGEDNGDSK
jgi:hypothetical protein